MGVVHLDGDLGGEQLELVAMLLAEAAHDVADGTGNQEVLLNQAQLLAADYGVGGIQHARDVFRLDLLLDRAYVVATIENLDVEIFGSAGGEQAQPIHRLSQVAYDRHVGRNADHGLVARPALPEIVLIVALGFHLAVEIDGDRFVGVLNLEWRAVGLPAIGLLALKAVEDFLAEEAVLIIDAVTEAGHAERRHGFQHAGGETSQAAVAQAGIGLAVQYVFQAETESGEHFAAKFFGAQV